MEKLLELRREYLQEVVARGGGQAREYLEEVARHLWVAVEHLV